MTKRSKSEKAPLAYPMTDEEMKTFFAGLGWRERDAIVSIIKGVAAGRPLADWKMDAMLLDDRMAEILSDREVTTP